MEAVTEYPEAKRLLEERGREILIKEGLLDEAAVPESTEGMDVGQKLDRLDNSLETLNTRFSRLLAEYDVAQMKLKQRLASLETQVKQDQQEELFSLGSLSPPGEEASAKP